MISKVYSARLSELGYAPPQAPAKAEPVLVRYPVWVTDRAAAVEKSARHVVLGTWFTSVLEEAISPVYGGYEPGSCPRAEAAAKHLINLPTHPRVTIRDAEMIAAVASDALVLRPDDKCKASDVAQSTKDAHAPVD
jgi:dTDP-4-amino-4,6-dideoxygalactose transaminase